MAKVKDIKAREVFNCKGDVTLEVDVILDSDIVGSFIVPNGESVAKYEAIELRDNSTLRVNEDGVQSAVDNVQKKIAPILKGYNPMKQFEIDNLLIEMDGTDNKSNLGANAVLGTSMAIAKAAAAQLNMPLFQYIGGKTARKLPLPIFSMISGGRHSQGNIDIQDFQIIPLNVTNFKDAMIIGKKVYHTLKNILLDRGMSLAVSATGAFMLSVDSHESILKLLNEAVEKTGYKPGIDVGFSMDIAAEMFYSKGKYMLKLDGLELDSLEFINLLEDFVYRYPIVLIEDPLGVDDLDGWRELTRRLSNKIEIVGDDLFASNINRFTIGVEQNITNSILVKPNQIGTLTETLEIVEEAKSLGFGTIISRRSGETEDTTIADIAVATNCGKVKFGSFTRTEGLSKYNRLLRIEDMLGFGTIYQGVKTIKSYSLREDKYLTSLFRPIPAIDSNLNQAPFSSVIDY